jgi:hypothetical protein
MCRATENVEETGDYSLPEYDDLSEWGPRHYSVWDSAGTVARSHNGGRQMEVSGKW